MAAFRQMGLGNPASILWERIPWSFVLDWFIPIGTYLELIGQVPFMKGRWCRTDKVQYEISGMVDGTSANAVQVIPGVYPAISGKQLQMRRVISFTPPTVPRPTLNVFGAVHGKRIGNAVALAHQVFAKAAEIPYSKSKGYSKKDLSRSVSSLEVLARAVAKF
jgi:hypothetical protein